MSDDRGCGAERTGVPAVALVGDPEGHGYPEDHGCPEDPFPPAPVPVVPDVSGLVRAVRRRGDLSQRELARAAGLSAATVGRIESGTLSPSLPTLGAVLAVAGVRLVAVDADDRKIVLMEDPPGSQPRDGAGRRYPSHLDTIVDPLPGEWWAERFGFAAPPETFRRDRGLRDAMRRRSTWEVRAEQQRHLPPPPVLEHWIQLSARCRHCGRLPAPLPPPFTPARVLRYLAVAARLDPLRAGAEPVAAGSPGGTPGSGPGR